MLMLWDTRSPTEPKLQIQAHDREILAVSCSPAVEHLIVTGSADKVSSLIPSLTRLTAHCGRPVYYMICVCQLRNYMYLSHTRTKYCIWLGHRTMQPSLPRLPAIDGSTFGICHLSDRNRRQMTRKMALQNCCSYMVVCSYVNSIVCNSQYELCLQDTPQGQQTFVGLRTSWITGRQLASRRITF